jgi:hypothetical protein
MTFCVIFTTLDAANEKLASHITIELSPINGPRYHWMLDAWRFSFISSTFPVALPYTPKLRTFQFLLQVQKCISLLSVSCWQVTIYSMHEHRGDRWQSISEIRDTEICLSTDLSSVLVDQSSAPQRNGEGARVQEFSLNGPQVHKSSYKLQILFWIHYFPLFDSIRTLCCSCHRPTPPSVLYFDENELGHWALQYLFITTVVI